MGFRDNERIGISDLSAFAQWVRAITKGYYKVSFDPSAVTAYVTSDKRMVFPRLNDKVTVRDMIRMRGFGIHETSHPRYQPDVWTVMKANPLPQTHPLAAIYNMLLDVHAETMRAQEWAGDAKALSEFGAVVGRDVTDRLRKEIADHGGIDPASDFFKVAQVMLASISVESSWNIGLRIGFAELQDTIMPADVQAGRDLILSTFDLENKLTNDTNNASTIWKLSKAIYKFLWPDKDPEQEVQKGKGKGKGKPGEEGKDAEEGESSGGEPGEGDNGGPPPTEPIPITVLVWSDHYETEAKGASGQGFDYTNHKEYNVYTPVDFNEFRVVDFENGSR